MKNNSNHPSMNQMLSRVLTWEVEADCEKKRFDDFSEKYTMAFKREDDLILINASGIVLPIASISYGDPLPATFYVHITSTRDSVPSVVEEHYSLVDGGIAAIAEQLFKRVLQERGVQ